jgi:hypothetical protein
LIGWPPQASSSAPAHAALTSLPVLFMPTPLLDCF